MNVLRLARERRFGEAGRILCPRRGTTLAFTRASDPAPLVARTLETAGGACCADPRAA